MDPNDAMLLPLRNRSRTIFIAVSILTSALVLDISFVRISDLSSDYQLLFSSWKIAAFTIISMVFVVAQFLIINFVNVKNKQMWSSRMLGFSRIHKVVSVLQYFLGAILVVVILQMVVLSYYNVGNLIAATLISYSLATTMMILLARRFFSWFKSNRNLIVLFYGLSAVALSINTVSTAIFVSDVLVNKPAVQLPYIESNPPFIVPGSMIDRIYSIYVISSVISFMLTWSATVLLLRHYSQKLGRIAYWIIVSIPLLYFLSQFFTLFQDFLVSPLLKSDPIFFGILFTLLFTLSKPAGGILFGVAFWTVARSIHRNSSVRDYMTISAYGLMLLFVSNQAVVLVDAPYPPFGIATVSFIGLSAYLILIGIYTSAVSVAQDSNLRRSIRTFASKESKLLDSIGTAHMEEEIQRRVVAVTKENQDRMTGESGIESSLTEEEIKDYLEQVMREVKKNKHEREND